MPVRARVRARAGESRARAGAGYLRAGGPAGTRLTLRRLWLRTGFPVPCPLFFSLSSSGPEGQASQRAIVFFSIKTSAAGASLEACGAGPPSLAPAGRPRPARGPGPRCRREELCSDSRGPRELGPARPALQAQERIRSGCGGFPELWDVHPRNALPTAPTPAAGGMPRCQAGR